MPCSFQLGNDIVQHAEKLRSRLRVHTLAHNGIADDTGNIGQLLLKFLALPGQGNNHLAGVLLALCAKQEEICEKHRRGLDN